MTKRKNSRGLSNQSALAIDRQVELPFRKALAISYRSLRVRFFRSMITTLSLVLAVSFLSFVSVSTDVANGMLEAHNEDYRQALIKAGYDLGPHDMEVDSSPKQRWIVVLSLLVCVVGIINAQLMAVTERFREIGTMKCLGALDRFILELFVLEAAMQGLVGASIGAVAGGFFAVLGFMVRFGFGAAASLSLVDFLMSLLISTTVGGLLSLIGVLYPAVVAARMQPVVAMRAEH
jgi:putative ABC transport system permease protein